MVIGLPHNHCEAVLLQITKNLNLFMKNMSDYCFLSFLAQRYIYNKMRKIDTSEPPSIIMP